MKYAWQKCPNQDVNILHTSTRLPTARYDPILGGVDAELDPEDRALVMSVRDIDGVVSVSMRDYECHIEKGELFEWAELRPMIVEAFRRRYKPTGTLVEMPERPSFT